MPKGKHVKPSSYSKPKFKKSLLFVLLSLVLLCIAFDILTPATDSKSIASTNEQENVTASEASVEPEPVVIEPSKDENMELLIKYEMEKYNFNKNNFYFFFYNVTDKKYYFYNENTYFTAASTIKVPVAMYYYDEINSGNYTLDTGILYASGCYEAGGGNIGSLYSVGDKVPLKNLLEQMIVNSDNTAINILMANLGYSNVKKAVTKYSYETVPEDFYTNNIASASFYYDVMNYLYEHQNEYTSLIDHMKKSSMGKYLKEYITDYDVAHKYGSYSGYVHDYGIVFTEKPYLVGIFTKGIPNSDEVIAKISKDILDYNLGNLDVNSLFPEEENTNTSNTTPTNTNTNS